MALVLGKKISRFISLAYLILAIICSFTFSTSQSFSYDKSNKDILRSEIYISSIAHTIDWLAEDTPTISKAYKYSNSPLRNGLLRVFIFAGTIGIAVFLAKSNFKIRKDHSFPILKTLVPLKLRI